MDFVFTLEEHNIVGGFGGAVSEVFAAHPRNAVLFRLGLQDQYPSIVGSQSYLLRHYGLDSTSIAQYILSKMKL
jgi:transketolase